MILIVDDDRSVTASIGLLLKQAGYATHAAGSPGEALAWLEGRSCDLVIQDMNFSRETSGEEGLALLARIKAVRPTLPVVLLTAWGSIDLAVRGIKAGAADFVTKPWSNPQLLQTVQTALGLAAAPGRGDAEPPPTREELDDRADFGELVGEDPQLLRVLETVARVAPTDASVLVIGESGTGKELIAEALHRNGARRRGPFVKVNLGGVSVSLFESEMFGHVRGAFTDARHDRKGRFEAAHGGTIFLDEIGDLDGASQVKLLRVLQDRTFEPLGSSQRVTVDVRVVSATNRPLGELVERGQFREDLLYRINLITLRLPALRDRAGDIPILSARFLQTIAARYRREPVRVSPEATRFLQQQPWPGNVRQLRQWIERAVLMRDARTIDVADLRAVADMDPAALERDVLPPVGAMTMDEIEKAMIVKSMKHHGGNVSRVSQALGLSRAALYRRLEKYGIPGVSLSARLWVYLVGAHVLAGGAFVWTLWQNAPWLVFAEVSLGASFAIGAFLVSRLFRTMSFSRDSHQWLADGDFTTRFQRVGQPQVDAQIDLYNRMIDDLRAARVAAQEQQQFLVQVMQASPAGMIVLDYDGRVVAINPAGARLIAIDATAAVGRSLAELGGPVPRHLATLAPGEQRLVSAGDGRRLRLWRGTFVDRGFRRSFFTVEELTDELRRLERAAHEKLIRLLSHEVNNTVGAAGSLLQSCLTYGAQLAADDRIDYEHALGVVIERTARLNEFMRGFADVYRLPAPRRHRADLRETVSAISALVAPQCEARSIRWDVAMPETPVAGVIDRGQIEQALLNVVKNAIEAVDRDGAIRVRLSEPGGRARLDIVDSGPGLSESARTNVFTPFFSTKSDGQGLGLTLVQEVLDNHGFPFALDGPPGGPTTFTVWFGERGAAGSARPGITEEAHRGAAR